MSTFRACTSGKAKRTALVVAAATAMGTIGLVAGPAPAQAACAQWGFDGKFVARHGNLFVHFVSEGANVVGRANSAHEVGNVSGDIKGRNMNFTVQWDGGAKGIYTGSVGDDGIARGSTYDERAQVHDVVNWHSEAPLRCLDAPAPPPVIAKVPRGGLPDVVEPEILKLPGGGLPPLEQKNSAITLRYDPPTLVGITAWVGITNNAGKPPVGCEYKDGVTPPQSFSVNGSAEARIDIAGIPTGTTYTITVTCDNGLTHSQSKPF
jgi:hypothetical protein